MEIKTEMDLDEEFLNNENVPMIHVEEKVLDLYLEWGLCGESISLLTDCGIQSIEILSIMHSHDIDEVFNKRKFLGEKIKFRYKLQKWRMENKVC